MVPAPAAPEVSLHLVRALIARWPDVFQGRLSPETTRFEPARPPGTGAAFEDTASGLRGTLNACASVSVQEPGAAEPRFLGMLSPDAPLPASIDWLHPNIPPGMRFVFNHDTVDQATLRPACPAATGDCRVLLSNPLTDCSVATIVRASKADARLETKSKIGRLNDVLVGCAQMHVATSVHPTVPRPPLGAAQQGALSGHWFLQLINPTFNIVLDPNANRHADDDIADLLLARGPDVAARLKSVQNGKQLDYWWCDPDSNTWAAAGSATLEQVLESAIKAADDQLSPADLFFVKSRRGKADIVYAMARRNLDKRLPELLDAPLPHCLPFANGMYDAASGLLRPFEIADLVSKTAGYALLPPGEVPPADAELVATFLRQVLPDDTERAYVLRVVI